MTACPSELELARAVSEGPGPELSAHLVTCTACREALEAPALVIELARKVRVPMPSADRREELRTHLLAAANLLPAVAPPRRSRRVWWLAGGAIAAAAAVMLLVVRRAPPPGHVHGQVIGHAGARFAISSEAPDETVTLLDGAIDVEVSPLHPGDRFRVITADTEIEVRGTAFEVTAELGHVTNVSVRHGLVEVRPHGAEPVMLGAGQVWTAPVRTARAATAPSVIELAPLVEPAPLQVARVVGVPVRRPAPPRNPPPAPTITAQPAPTHPALPTRPADALSYDEAWDAMRGGKFERAATAFARVTILDPAGALAEDASYWYPVALARAKRADAVSAFRDFLDRYPRSAHAHEASVMLGWLLVDAKQTAEAEKRFRAAIGDSSAEVRDSARAGLAALGAH